MDQTTHEHLSEAFAGESQAHMKYLNHAKQAELEGKPQAGRIFRAASYSEQMHATRHLEVLEGLGNTPEHLAAATAGETFEIETMYPGYIAQAVEQGEEEARVTLYRALETEKVHQALYRRAQENLAAGGDVEVAELWVCDHCGFTMEGAPPEVCPLCHNPRKNFVQF